SATASGRRSIPIFGPRASAAAEASPRGRRVRPQHRPRSLIGGSSQTRWAARAMHAHVREVGSQWESYRLMEILITGALGVNGASLLRNLCERQIHPIVLENRIDLSLVRDLVGRFEIVQGDINDLAAFIRALQKYRIQRLVHMAALMPPAAEADPY